MMGLTSFDRATSTKIGYSSELTLTLKQKITANDEKFALAA